MKLTVDGYEFDFPHAVEAFKFDDTDTTSQFFHGVQQLKAVDMIAEFSKCYLWVEIKSYDDLTVFDDEQVCEHCKGRVNHRKWLKRNLVQKFRDTFLYRFCEKKLDKPIVYVCLLNFDTALLSYFKKELSYELPTGNKNHKRWNRSLLEKERLFVTNEAGWNRNLLDYGTCKFVG